VEFGPIEERGRIEAFLRKEPGLHVYGLADLDDAFWPNTRWYAASERGSLRAICLLFDGLEPPVLLALAPRVDAALEGLVEHITPNLPDALYVHYSPGLEAALDRGFRREVRERNLKMLLREPARARAVDTAHVEPLGVGDLDELRAFYAPLREGAAEGLYALEAYMLESGSYFGVREAGVLVSAGGVHVWSERYGTAALGNIATRPDRRARGLARAVTARICAGLAGRVRHVGLNVAAGNAPALSCYQSVGFAPVAPYFEASLRRHPGRGC